MARNFTMKTSKSSMFTLYLDFKLIVLCFIKVCSFASAVFVARKYQILDQEVRRKYKKQINISIIINNNKIILNNKYYINKKEAYEYIK